MNEVFKILKMRIEDKNGRLSDINIVEAFLTKYAHPHSEPYNISLKTKNTLTEGAILKVKFLIKDENEFRKTTCKISCNLKKNQDEPNEYTLG